MSQHLTIAALIVSLLVITNPIGNAAIFLGLTGGRTLKEQRKIAVQCGIASAMIMVIVAWLGLWVLKAFGISISAFQIAGGLIVVLIGLSMLRGREEHHERHKKRADTDSLEHETRDTIGVMPLAMPLVAGPGAITVLIAHGVIFTTFWGKLFESAICIGVAIVVGLTMFFAPSVKRVLGDFGINIITRLMGLILCAIAFQMIIAGILRVLLLFTAHNH